MIRIEHLFEDKIIIEKIQNKLPLLFEIAEINHSRAGKLGMEIGSERERILIALMIYYFGRENVNTEIPINKTETDVVVSNENISIKTITNSLISGVKVIWTVDREKVLEFIRNYDVECKLLLVHINWNKSGVYI
ncbi:MAG: ThaI family type II restriction endonuclease [Opitutae bacterium]|nr:ThaI family type II restriction endonuclease [Opitutae bacterium]